MSTSDITIRPGKHLKKSGKIISRDNQIIARPAEKESVFKKALADFLTLENGKKGLNKKVKLDELHTFANQLSVLLNSGVPLVQALKILGDQAQNKQFKGVVFELVEEVNRGHTLHDGLSRFPKVFPNIFISLVKVAEMSGGLPQVLNQISQYLREQDRTRKRIRSATAYPRFVFFFFSFILIAVIYGLVPKFQSTFATYNAKLPLMTDLLLGASTFALRYVYVEIILVILVFVGYKSFLKTDRGQYFSSRFKLKIPVFGEILRKDIVSRFCRTLLVLIKSGVPLVNAIEVASQTAQNLVFTHALQRIKNGIINGDTFARQMAEQQIFPEMVVKMIATGEQSGSLEMMLKNIADLYDADLETKIAGISSVIEPVLMVGLGIIAIFVILALYLPIFKMGSIM